VILPRLDIHVVFRSTLALAKEQGH
jgi:hypothetical protein